MYNQFGKGKIERHNIDALQSTLEQMLQKHSGSVRLQVWTSDPDSLFSAMTEVKGFTVAADDSGEQVFYSASSKVKTVPASAIQLLTKSDGDATVLFATNLVTFAIYTPHCSRYSSDEIYCIVDFTSTGVRVYRKEYAPPYEGKRSSPVAFWSVLELTLL